MKQANTGGQVVLSTLHENSEGPIVIALSVGLFSVCLERRSNQTPLGTLFDNTVYRNGLTLINHTAGVLVSPW